MTPPLATGAEGQLVVEQFAAWQTKRFGPESFSTKRSRSRLRCPW